MGTRLGIWLGALAVAASSAASGGAAAAPVPGPADAGRDGPPLTALGPPPQKAPPPTDPPEKRPPIGQPSEVMSADRPMIQRLHEANQLEIQMGKLAQEKGSSRATKNLGRRLVADHTAAEKKLDDYLRKHRSSVAALATSAAADPDHELLATRSGVEFDRAFGLQIVADQTKTIDMLQSARIATYDDALRELYEQMIDTQETHKRVAQDVVASAARS